MTTYNRSATPTIAGTLLTQNVTDADTILFTVSGGVSSYSIIAGTNCTLNKSSMNSGDTVTITFSSSSVGSWNCTVGGFTSSKEPEYYYTTISGSVSASAVAYSVTSGSISLGGIQTFFGDTGSIALGDLYKGGGIVPNISQNSGVPTSGTIDLADFYGVYKT